MLTEPALRPTSCSSFKHLHRDWSIFNPFLLLHSYWVRQTDSLKCQPQDWVRASPVSWRILETIWTWLSESEWRWHFIYLWYLLSQNPELHLNTLLNTSDQYSLKLSRSSDKRHPPHTHTHAICTCTHKYHKVISCVQCQNSTYVRPREIWASMN